MAIYAPELLVRSLLLLSLWWRQWEAIRFVRGVCTLISDYFTYQIQHHFGCRLLLCVASRNEHDQFDHQMIFFLIVDRCLLSPRRGWTRALTQLVWILFLLLLFHMSTVLTALLCFWSFDGSMVCSFTRFVQLFTCSRFVLVSVSAQRWISFKWKITEP